MRNILPAKAVIALAGNPNVGKSTVFNALTGMKQHTGNWPGKTVALAEGVCRYREECWRLVDLPGTYSLAAKSGEEEVARDFLIEQTPDAVVAVCDATCLSRSLILALQIAEINPRTVVCVNLMDEAKKKGIAVDRARLEEALGLPVVTTNARDKQGLTLLLNAIKMVMQNTPAPLPVRYTSPIKAAVATLPLPYSQALRVLESAAYAERIGVSPDERNRAIATAKEQGLSEERLQEAIVSCVVLHAEALGDYAVVVGEEDTHHRDRKFDRILTGRWTGWMVMALLLCVILWVTVCGANYLSEWLSIGFGWGRTGLYILCERLGVPWWFQGMLVDGAYAVLTWVVAVMLPPMAIFFPLFTLLEDVGYLPRIAFNLDRGFQRACTCGKQALTMCMGFGCNAAGVTGCRILDSPRERVIATVTNSLVPCNGRFPMLITIITLFFAGTTALSSLRTVGMLGGMLVLGVTVTLLASWLLSKTVLRGVPSAFTLELPPYRMPRVGQVLLRSLLDRTLFVLGRAVVVAAPVGVLIWLLANVTAGGVPLLQHAAAFLDPLGRCMGLDGTVLLAFVLGFPANEIVVPIMVMTYTTGSTLTETGLPALREILTTHGWTSVTAWCMMVFSLFHWPCSTTCITVWKETRRVGWTVLAVLLPTGIGVLLCVFSRMIASFVGI